MALGLTRQCLALLYGFEEGSDEVRSSYIWIMSGPVSVAINNDEEVMSCM